LQKSRFVTFDEQPLSPAEAALYGLVAGFAATALVSALTRLPVIREHGEQLSTWQRLIGQAEESPMSKAITPATALAQAAGPGPEGPAGLFAAKIGSGLFGKDLGKNTSTWGKLVHFAYGSLWGLLYGILQTRSAGRRPVVAGMSHGIFMWALGPGTLATSMKLVPAPSQAPRKQTAISVGTHLIYGLALATLFSQLTHTGSPHASDG
jgi:hypothetical protein